MAGNTNQAYCHVIRVWGGLSKAGTTDSAEEAIITGAGCHRALTTDTCSVGANIARLKGRYVLYLESLNTKKCHIICSGVNDMQ